jgi:DNA-binding beta-propeller fold protein YncE
LELRPLLVLFALVTTLAACSVASLEKFATEADRMDVAAASRSGTGLSQKVGTELLSAESIIKGGRRSIKGMAGQFQRLLIGGSDEVSFQEPVAVGGVEGLLYIVDAGPKVVYKYDLVINEIEPVPDIAIHFVGSPGNIYVAKDRSFYIVDSSGRQVLHFSEYGELKTRFQDLANLSRPMDVVVDEESGDVLVADGSFSHIVVFNSAGKAIKAIGRRGTGPGRFRAITFMGTGADGLYVLDRLELPVQVLSFDGEYRYSFGESELTFPNALAVDRDQRVFISDRSDNTIRVYQDGQLLMTFGGGGSAPGRFRLISSMWVSGNLLYVADSMNRRVQVLRINPGAALPVMPVS